MKGQYFTLDVIVAGIIALVAMMVLISYWQYSLENTPLFQDALNKEAIKVSQILFTDKGDFGVFKEGMPSLLDDDFTQQDPFSNVEKRVKDVEDSVPGNICLVIKVEDGTSAEVGSCNEKRGAKVERLAYVEKDGIQLAFIEMYYYY